MFVFWQFVKSILPLVLVHHTVFGQSVFDQCEKMKILIQLRYLQGVTVFNIANTVSYINVQF
jgi:hypothetical protein